jgi:hypothetical protein
MLWFLSETSHPGSRGVDKLELGTARKWVILNPFRSLGLLRSPNLLAVTLVASFALIGLFGIVMPLAYTIVGGLLVFMVQFTPRIQGARYEIRNEAVLAIFFSTAGLGNIRESVSLKPNRISQYPPVGAAVAGRLSDHVIIKWRKLRMGKWVPEDRLRAALLATGVLIPVPILASGVVTKYVPGTLGMGINLACLFITGVGVRLSIKVVCDGLRLNITRSR